MLYFRTVECSNLVRINSIDEVMFSNATLYVKIVQVCIVGTNHEIFLFKKYL